MLTPKASTPDNFQGTTFTLGLFLVHWRAHAIIVTITCIGFKVHGVATTGLQGEVLHLPSDSRPSGNISSLTPKDAVLSGSPGIWHLQGAGPGNAWLTTLQAQGSTGGGS
jgi:hypothetical protein